MRLNRKRIETGNFISLRDVNHAAWQFSTIRRLRFCLATTSSDQFRWEYQLDFRPRNLKG